MDSPAPIEVRGVVKTFPGVRALDGVDLEVRRGEVHAVVGENGAGKSTLMHILAGILQPDAGTIRFEGEPARWRNPHHAARNGIGVVFQELSLVPNLSIAENIFANRQPLRWGQWIDAGALGDRTRTLLRLFDLDLNPSMRVKHLSMAQQQVVEILKALSLDPKLLILDEPTSSLTGHETRLLFDTVRRLKDEGVSFIYISHHLLEIFAVADRVTVLRDGKTVDTIRVDGTSEEQLVRMMVGRDLANMYGTRTSAPGEPYFRVEHASRGRAFRDVSFALRRGEILGVAGLVGSGRTELGRALFGAEPLDDGCISLDGRTVRIRSPRDAIGRRIMYTTEDRKSQGLFLRMGVQANCVAPSIERFAGRFGFLDDGGMRTFAERARTAFNIVTPSLDQCVGNLSGGNQQKVLLSMGFGVEPAVLIADEPTRGVDVGAKSEIYARLRALAATGVGIVLISSDLIEILG
ncbi:MAG: sugar ABC transporter ATP-binding protein, partial [Candidatus Hydrogenedentes bacterium]|nr:sugar ABC transporter ATP-binding protein [Candidatus Hydrogenedentota bacterium]